MELLLAFLAMVTLGGALIFALVSKRKVEERRRDPAAHRDENKSHLAKDAPDHDRH